MLVVLITAMEIMHEKASLFGMEINGPFSKYIHNKICIFMTIDKNIK